ncbi:MAG: hypothetical protein EXR49_06010 [Dehalococcoidia bacterium]|nr:hypothetical protein [Dehalococcoidia bacterium]
MTSRTTASFRRSFSRLPESVQEQAPASYRLFAENPQHSELRFKQIHATRSIYSVRVSLGYRAIGMRDDDVMVWFWIGSHSDYEQMIGRM